MAAQYRKVTASTQCPCFARQALFASRRASQFDSRSQTTCQSLPSGVWKTLPAQFSSGSTKRPDGGNGTMGKIEKGSSTPGCAENGNGDAPLHSLRAKAGDEAPISVNATEAMPNARRRLEIRAFA